MRLVRRIALVMWRHRPWESAVSEMRGRASAAPTILFVFGMARSGTSALTRVLSLCGAALPAGMLGADKTNERGYWEPRESIYLNRKILQRQGSAWWKTSILEVETLDPDDYRAALTSINRYMAQLPVAPLVVIKDPHIVFLADLWFDAARQAGFNVATVIAVRHPSEVIGSLEAIATLTPEHASVLWLKASLLAERKTRSVPRVFVDYGRVLDDWRREVKRISVDLSVELDCGDEQAVDTFLTPELRHYQSASITDRFGAKWISSVYGILSTAAHDGPINTPALDRILDEYLASERDFRAVFEAERRYSDKAMTRVLGPTVLKWIMDVRAMAHRHRGTWA